MPRGETEFEEARIKADFLAVFKRVSEMGMAALMDTYEYTYRAGRIAGKQDARRMMGVDNSNAAVVDRTEPQKGQEQ